MFAEYCAGWTAINDRRRDEMSTISKPVNTMSYEAKPLVLDVVRTERQAFYDLIDDPANWELQTRCSEWQVRDVAGHMIDVTEGYLARGGGARRGAAAPDGCGGGALAAAPEQAALGLPHPPPRE